MNSKIRVLLAKAGLDGHQAGIRLVAQALRDAGVEVVYLGLYSSVEQIVRAAVEEQVDVVGLSSLSGAHMETVPQIATALRNAGLEDTLIIVGGVIPKRDVPALLKAGVARVFQSGAPLDEITTYVKETAHAARVKESIPT